MNSGKPFASRHGWQSSSATVSQTKRTISQDHWTTRETDKQVKFWVNRAQHSKIQTDQFHEDQLKLNLQKNEDGLYESRGRIQGSYLIYLPPDALLSALLGGSHYDFHLSTV